MIHGRLRVILNETVQNNKGMCPKQKYMNSGEIVAFILEFKIT